VVACDDMIGLVGVLRGIRFILGLAASLQVGIAEVQAVLVDLDVGRRVDGAVTAAAREVIGWRLRRIGLILGAELVRNKARDDASLYGRHVPQAVVVWSRRAGTDAV